MRRLMNEDNFVYSRRDVVVVCAAAAIVVVILGLGFGFGTASAAAAPNIEQDLLELLRSKLFEVQVNFEDGTETRLVIVPEIYYTGMSYTCYIVWTGL